MLRSIVDQARQGDEEAFADLVREVGDRCIFIAHRILRDASLAEDAVQVALVRAWRDLPTLRDPDHFEGHLVSAADIGIRGKVRITSDGQVGWLSPVAGQARHAGGANDPTPYGATRCQAAVPNSGPTQFSSVTWPVSVSACR